MGELRSLDATRGHEVCERGGGALDARRGVGPDGPYKALQSTLRRLNLPRERLHALRAFFVTILLSGNVPVHVVRELVGHGNLATTQGYAAILAPDRGAAVGVLDRVYQGARGGQADRMEEEEGAWRTEPARRRRSRQRIERASRRIRALRTRVLERIRGAGNNVETAPIAV